MFHIPQALQEDILHKQIERNHSPIKELLFDNKDYMQEQGIIPQALYQEQQSHNKQGNTTNQDNIGIILLDHHAAGIQDLYKHQKNILLMAPIGITCKDITMTAHIQDFIEKGWKVWSPRSISMLQKIINSSGKHYIPYTAQTLESQLDQLDYSRGVLNLQQVEYSGSDACILTFSHLLSQVTRASKDAELQADIFGFYRYDHKRTPEIRESIQKHQQIILIMDMLTTDPYIKNIYQEIRQLAQTKHSITHIYPHYENITSIHTEYIEEQAGFDHYALSDKLRNHIKT